DEEGPGRNIFDKPRFPYELQRSMIKKRQTKKKPPTKKKNGGPKGPPPSKMVDLKLVERAKKAGLPTSSLPGILGL
ncbi:MAG: hypothetical protein OEV30_11335, partial [Ignavibacteria bacterium]|nr:hypothetical protein [Ignavibacteria bacterium]